MAPVGKTPSEKKGEQHMNPKDLKGFLVGAITVASSLSVLAAVTIPHTFQSGTPISAKDMNENFSSLKTFADALEAGKQTKITGSPCAAGQFVQGIGADGALTCGVDQIGSSGNAGVSSLNGKTGSLVVQAGTGVTIDASQAGKIIVNSTGGSVGLPFAGTSNSSNPAFSVTNSTGIALSGSSQSGNALYGISSTGYGLSAYSESSFGVVGFTSTGIAGVYGESKVSGATGVRGVNSVGPGSSGVWGESSLGSGVRGSSTSGNGVLGNSSRGYGVKGSVSDAGTGVYGENTSNAAGAGVQGRADAVNSVGVGGVSANGVGVSGTGPIAMQAQGNTVQNLDAGGWAKAMVVIGADRSIVRCYNGITGASSGGCGFKSTTGSLLGYKIDFGFDVSNRFISLTGLPDGSILNNPTIFEVSGTSVNVLSSGTSSSGVKGIGSFSLIIF
jgi:hypothetical protein